MLPRIWLLRKVGSMWIWDLGITLTYHLRFPLIVPRTTNEYNPMEDLKSAIEAIIIGMSDTV
jgi:hypothetical protein